MVLFTVSWHEKKNHGPQNSCPSSAIGPRARLWPWLNKLWLSVTFSRNTKNNIIAVTRDDCQATCITKVIYNKYIWFYVLDIHSVVCSTDHTKSCVCVCETKRPFRAFTGICRWGCYRSSMFPWRQMKTCVQRVGKTLMCVCVCVCIDYAHTCVCSVDFCVWAQL